MSESTWISPVQIIDTKILGVNFNYDDEYKNEDLKFSLTINSSIEDPVLVEEAYQCKCVLEAIGDWSSPEEPRVGYSASCKLGITIVILKESALFSTEKETFDYIVANAVSLAYGKIRSIIEGITVDSPVGKQTIPAIDAFAFLASVKKTA